MKISYNWLKHYFPTELVPKKIAELLTDSGLEISGMESHQSIKGGMEGLVIGEVLTKVKHPNADKLSLTTVSIGKETPLHIVCGAPNVSVGQKVVVATVGCTLFPVEGESFKIKESKIRGELSQGMLCAEDEIGFGKSHDGIMVLDANTKIGSLAKEYFEVETDTIFEVELTPNRVDAASHIGVARDLKAVLTAKGQSCDIVKPSVEKFAVNNPSRGIMIEVKNSTSCPRYSGITIGEVEVKESPKWLKNRLQSIGVRPINNIVDITNFVLHELGQPLHAFDADKIGGKKVIVRNAHEGEKFVTLDGVERTLSEEDLMICDVEKPLCIAGVFGGLSSGVSLNTKTIFLESAYFNSVAIRKTAKRHGLNTDASFRYERGADPSITDYALKRAALLIIEIAGGKITSSITDLYPTKISDFEVSLKYDTADRLIGKKIERETIKNILTSLEISIQKEDSEGLLLSVPAFKVDVQREVDVIEEILRIYGYNTIELPQSLKSSLSFSEKPNKQQLVNTVSDFLCSVGFNETMSNSLTNAVYYEKTKLWDTNELVHVLNPVSTELNVMRQTLLFSTLETISHNLNRKNSDLKLFEFGTIYKTTDTENNYKCESRVDNDITKPEVSQSQFTLSAIEVKTVKPPFDKLRMSKIKTNFPTFNLHYKEEKYLSLSLTGNTIPENWKQKQGLVNFFDLKGYINAVISRMGLDRLDNRVEEATEDYFSYGLTYKVAGKQVASFGLIIPKIRADFDIKQPVFYGEFSWDTLLELSVMNRVKYKPIPKFPSVRRDLALLVDEAVKYSDIEKLAYELERKLLKEVNLFDVYQGKGIQEGKKSYAVSFLFRDDEQTLTDNKVDAVMKKVLEKYKEVIGAELR